MTLRYDPFEYTRQFIVMHIKIPQKDLACTTRHDRRDENFYFHHRPQNKYVYSVNEKAHRHQQSTPDLSKNQMENIKFIKILWVA